ncbi:SAM-dependent methyltransferase [Candidatus Scalindua japonica]|uniref:SAM-dependent methyltransferase n=1 Tax=Candidatus Scalindua japonica TaxID=1284222 RepID=A0A286TVT2_9BACT|nr:class I SAM-dependent methyltransferase [Candidatus Scalindua japonica]GAX60008.1 SAM-dependent methyltransferase [Candidatus Scalindua japonica]
MIDYYSPLKSERIAEYGDNPRTEIVDLVREAPENVFEIGCGSGATGMAIKQKFPKVTYIGLDSNGDSIDIAQSRLDRVIVSDIEKVPLDTFGLEKECFDLIICADILEHLYDPWKVLHCLHDYLTTDGKIIASIPNVQYINHIINFMHGKWKYDDNGLLDATHIRFFTLNEIVKMFTGTGYNIIHCSGATNPKLNSDTWPSDFDFGKFVLKNITREEAFRFSVLQYLIIAERVDSE